MNMAAPGILKLESPVADCGSVVSSNSIVFSSCTDAECGCSEVLSYESSFPFDTALASVNNIITWADGLTATTVTQTSGNLAIDTTLALNVFDFASVTNPYDNLAFDCSPGACTSYTGSVIFRNFGVGNVNSAFNAPGSATSVPQLLVLSSATQTMGINPDSQAIFMMPNAELNFNGQLHGAVFCKKASLNQGWHAHNPNWLCGCVPSNCWY